MDTIRLRNFGPIKDTGIIALSEVMLIIGRQSSGKSAFMKVLCYCRWLEKKVMTSTDRLVQVYTHNKRFLKDLKQFHRIDELYFTDDTCIEYEGEAITISYMGKNQNARIMRKPTVGEAAYNTKLSYIPAERNLVSAVRNINSVYKTKDRDVLFNFIQEWNESKEGYTSGNKLDLSLTDDFKYYNEEGQDFVMLPGGQPITSYYASSGVQSVMPIDVMSDHFMGLVGQVVKYSREDLMNRLIEMLGSDNVDAIDAKSLSDDDLTSMREKMTYQSARLFIEEPERNLYSDAQRNLVLNLIRRLKKVQDIGTHHSSIVLTTHSPYVLSTLNTLVYDAAAMSQKTSDERLKKIIDESTLLPLEAYSAYFIDEGGRFKDIIDKEVPMFSGIDLDGVSDWVENHTNAINEILFGYEGA